MSRRARTAASMFACTLAGFAIAMMLGFGSPRVDDPPAKDAVALSAIPAAVTHSIDAHVSSGTPTPTHAWKITENDTNFYLVRCKMPDGHKAEFKVVEDGRLTEVVHTLSPDKLPVEIADQVRKLIPKGEITNIEQQNAIRWLIDVKDGDKTREVFLRADGKHSVRDVEAKPAGK
jgi:hypothetical protein